MNVTINNRTTKLLNTGLNTEKICDETVFYGLKDVWNKLAETAGSHSVFLRHEWFDSAWQWRRTDSCLWLLLIYDDSLLIGIAPLLIASQSRRGLRIRKLTFLTVPDTQFCDVITKPGRHLDVIGAIANFLHANRDEWDILELSHLATSSQTATVLRHHLEMHHLLHASSDSDINLYVELAGNWKDFYGARSRRLKKANNLVANRLHRASSSVEIDCICFDKLARDESDLAMDVAIQLSANSWKKSTGLSLDQPGPGAFFRRLADHARNNSWLTLWLLRINSLPVAMELQLNHEGHVYALRADFDESMKQHSPGSYLNWKVLESLFNRNLQRYWLGPGENGYKLHWTSAHEKLRTITVYGRSRRGRISAFLELVLRPKIKILFGMTDKQASPESAHTETK